jgi:hypothetical protein
MGMITSELHRPRWNLVRTAMKTNYLIVLSLSLTSLLVLACAAHHTFSGNRSKGIVIDPSGKPIPDAMVSITFQDSTNSFKTDRDGIFRFDKSTLSQGALSIEAEGYSKLKITLCEDWISTMKDPYYFKFTIYPTSSLKDTSGTGSVAGIVTDTNGSPIPGVGVYIEGTTMHAFSGIDGSYKISGIPAGNHDFRCETTGYSLQIINTVATEPNNARQINFRLVVCPCINCIY